MKKSWKIIGIVGGAIVILGVVFCGVGLMLGASLRDMSWSVSDSWGSEETMNAAQGSEVNVYEGVKSLECKIGEGVVEVIEYDEAAVKVVGNKHLQVFYDKNEEGGLLNLERKGDQGWRFWNREISENDRVQIYVPEGMVFQEASFELGAGMLQADILRADDMNVKIGVGEMKVGSCEAKEMDIDCGAGSVECTMVGALEEYNYEMDCGVGEISLGNHQYSGLGKNENINNSAAKEISIDCGVGNVTLLFQN